MKEVTVGMVPGLVVRFQSRIVVARGRDFPDVGAHTLAQLDVCLKLLDEGPHVIEREAVLPSARILVLEITSKVVVLLDTADDFDGELPHECTRRCQAVAHQEHGERWRDRVEPSAQHARGMRLRLLRDDGAGLNRRDELEHAVAAQLVEFLRNPSF